MKLLFFHCRDLVHDVGTISNLRQDVLAHLSQRLTRRAYSMGLEPASVRVSVCLRNNTFKHEYQFYLKHHWDG